MNGACVDTIATVTPTPRTAAGGGGLVRKEEEWTRGFLSSHALEWATRSHAAAAFSSRINQRAGIWD